MSESSQCKNIFFGPFHKVRPFCDKIGRFSLPALFILATFLTPAIRFAQASENDISPSLNPAIYSFLSAPALVSTQNINLNSSSNILIQNYGLVAFSIPSNQEVLYQGENIDSIFVYYVEKGDTISSIAKKFDIDVETLLWANNLSLRSLLKIGQELTILPISGISYSVKKGDSVQSIAKKYKADPEDILAFNNLQNASSLNIGQKIIIPDGKIEGSQSIGVYELAPRVPYAPSAPKYITALTPASFIVYPTSGKNWGIKHYNNAADIANSCGTPVYAAADGKALGVALTNSNSRYANGGYGNNIRIQHVNGVTTLYAHLKESFIIAGQEIKQGQLIALMGGQPGTPGAGRSTGCHLHFEVRGATNPLIRYY